MANSDQISIFSETLLIHNLIELAKKKKKKKKDMSLP